MKIYDLRLEDNQIYYAAGTNSTIALVEGSTSGVGNYIPLSGNLTPTTGYINVGDGFGLNWSNSNTFISAYPNDLLFFTSSSAGAMFPETIMQLFPDSINMISKLVSIGNPSTNSILIDESLNAITFYNNGFFANFDNSLLTVDRNYQLPDNDGTIATLNNLTNFIKIDGSSIKTTGNIKVGDSFGLTWGTSGSTKMIGYENDVIQIETANTSGQSSFIQITPELVDIHAANSASLGNGNDAFVIDNTLDGASIVNNGYYSTFRNNLLTGNRTYNLPDESGEFMLGTRVKFRTTANLTANYNNGVGGVGATLTATTNSTLPTIDAITVANQNVGDRLLVANQTAMLQNGIYVITSKGVAGVSPFILTRASDDDSSDKIYKKIIKIDLGSAFASSTTINTNTTTITMGTTSITYVVHGNYTTGAGIALANRTFSISNSAISRAMLVNGVATSIIGRSVNTTGAVADIQATSSGQVLKRVGTTLGFHSIGFDDLPFQVLSNSYSSTGTATTTFTVSIGQTLANTTYKVNITPSNLLSSALLYVNNKTTTTFDVVYQAGLTGAVAFDWQLYK